MLIVEVDGDTHAESHVYDERRTRLLEERGYRVVRFTNADVIGNLDGVLMTIAEALDVGPAPLPSHRDARLVPRTSLKGVAIP